MNNRSDSYQHTPPTSHTRVHALVGPSILHVRHAALVSDAHTTCPVMVVCSLQPSVTWNCSGLNPTMHLHPLTTLYHHGISLATLPLAAVLSTPHSVVKIACVAGSGDGQGCQHKQPAYHLVAIYTVYPTIPLALIVLAYSVFAKRSSGFFKRIKTRFFSTTV